MATVSKRTWTRNGKDSSSWQVTWVENNRQHKKSTFKTKKEADTWAVLKEKDLLDGVSRNVSHRMTVAEAADEYVKHMERRQAAGSIGLAYVKLVRSYCYNYIAKPDDWKPKRSIGGGKCHAPSFSGAMTHKKLSDLRPRHMESFRDALIDGGLNHRTVRAVMITVHGIFELCRRQDYIAVNPASRIAVEAPRHLRNVRVQPPSREILDRVIREANPRVKLMIEFAATTGLRLGEMRALRWASVDLDRRVVAVSCSVDARNVVGPPKSAAGIRRVPISDALVTRLASYRLSTPRPQNDDLVFPARDGTYIGSHVPLGTLNRIADRLGIPRIRWHSLRHYAVSSWIAADLNLKVVQTFAGHSNVSTTANIYGHLFPDDDYSRQIDSVGSALIR